MNPIESYCVLIFDLEMKYLDCLFCKIASGEIPSKKIYEDEKILAFEDINPAAPVHILIIPKRHIDSIDSITTENVEVISHIFELVPKIAKEHNLEQGYRLVTNVGKLGGQTVEHLHFHLLGGRKMRWPAG